MKNIFRITSTILAATAFSFSSAHAGDAGHSVTIDWSAAMSIEQNFEAAQKTVANYCKREARKVAPRDRSFAKAYRAHCEESLLENFVVKTNSPELTNYYSFVKNPETRIRKFAGK